MKQRHHRPIGALLLVATALVLGGCASTRTIDSDVRSFSSVASIAPGAPFSFERLPSQQAQAVQQAQLEQIAQPALERAGLRRDDAAARYTVQVSLDSRRDVRWDPWGGGPWGPGWGGRFYGRGYRSGGFGGFGWRDPFFSLDRVLYQQEVTLVVREQPGGRVVYETHAFNDELQPADAAVLAVLFDAALSGFPAAPPGIRRVQTVIPR